MMVYFNIIKAKLWTIIKTSIFLNPEMTLTLETRPLSVCANVKP